ncbi:PREDICTED: uncharacterized protein LOC108561212 [Nicrophorus vespilloides]|uniref:Uncharacterized protein LOC108561212 n=1 Tax=Nicrophorus vespilloides TaxID=110193 RepID=A0ABM1MIZ6_NICVS|nr:PREDICTED: uncharacterized protein LOC108561212 [Nicrophorus vespilloides]XP_017774547.1 PREDICTED: uncharacterized protein LOC108561212 [Nicrophorus vespilloides]
MLVASISSKLVSHEWQTGNTQNEYGSDSGSDINTISWSKDGAWMVMVPSIGNPEILSFNNDKLKSIYTIKGISGVTCASFQNNSKRNVVLGTDSGQLMVYDIKTNSVKKKFQYAPAALFKIQYCLKDTHIVAGCENGEIFVYNNNSGLLSSNFRVSKSKTLMNFECHNFKRNLIGGCSEEGIVAVWDINTSKSLASYECHNAAITDITFSTLRSDYLVSAGMDRKLCFYDFMNKKPWSNIKLPKIPTAIDFCPDGIGLLVGFTDGKLIAYDTRKMSESLAAFDGHDSKIHQIIFEKHMDEKISEISLPEESNESIEPVREKSTQDSFAKMFCGDHLPDIPEVENESCSKDNIRDSFMDAMCLNSINQSSQSIRDLHLSKDSKLLLPERIPTESDITFKSVVEKFKASQASTPNLNKNPLEISATVSPIISQNATKLDTTPQSSSRKTDMKISNANEYIADDNVKAVIRESLKETVQKVVREEMDEFRKDMKQQLRDIIYDIYKEEVEEFKTELKYQSYDVMGATRRQFLDLHMCVIKEFIKVEDQFSKLREDLFTGDYISDSIVQENMKLSREITQLKEKLNGNK